MSEFLCHNLLCLEYASCISVAASCQYVLNFICYYHCFIPLEKLNFDRDVNLKYIYYFRNAGISQFDVDCDMHVLCLLIFRYINNNIHYLQLGCHPVAAVILRV